MSLKPLTAKTKEPEEPPAYYLCFEDYLKPENFKKPSQLLLSGNTLTKSQQRLKLLEQPVIKAPSKTKWQIVKRNLKTKIKLKNLSRISKFAIKWKYKTFRKCAKCKLCCLTLPRWLGFLASRKDEDLCRRKTSFELFCEISSIHGFINFVDATSWQKTFWSLVILIGLVLTAYLLLLSHFMSSNTPTRLYSETSQYSTSNIPFPAVTICNLNRISKSKAESLAKDFLRPNNITSEQLTQYFNLALYTSQNVKASSPQDYKTLNDILKTNNYTLVHLLDDITPDCNEEVLRCKWQGRFVRCPHLFRKIRTTVGLCCSFNYNAVEKKARKRLHSFNFDNVEYNGNCGYKTGLTVLLNPFIGDYQASMTKSPGFLILLHASQDFSDPNAIKRYLTVNRFNKIHVYPTQTYATDFVANEALDERQCYLPHERHLFYFAAYSQINCLAECRSSLFYEKCKCSVPNWPKRDNWTECGLEQRECYGKYKYLLSKQLKFSDSQSQNAQFICDCFPACDFNMYNVGTEMGVLIRKYSLTDKRFYKNLNITNHTLLHVFWGELYAERLRLDVYENWLTYVAIFGGIINLYMGYSFVSGSEILFFLFIRSVFNWMTKKQIKYRIRKRQKEAECKKKQEEELRKQERIEAFLRMRPYCPEYAGQ